MSLKEIKKEQTNYEPLISNILKKKISYFSLPFEIQSDPEIKSRLYNEKFLLIERGGYDIRTMKFFALEVCQDDEANHYSFEGINRDGTIYYPLPIHYFDDIEDYFNFVLGNIYSNTCFYQYDFSNEFIKKHNIDRNKLNFDSVTKETLSHYIDHLINDEKILQINLPSSPHQRNGTSRNNQQKLICAIESATKYENFKINVKLLESLGTYSEEQIVTQILQNCTEQTKSFVLAYIFDIEKRLVTWINAICNVLDKETILDYLQSSINALNLDGLTKEYQMNFTKEIGYYSNSEEFYSLLAEIVEKNYGDPSIYSYLKRQNNIINDIDNSHTYYCDIKIGKRNAYVQICKSFYDDSINKTRFSVSLTFYKNNKYIVRNEVNFQFFFDFIHFVEGDMSHMDLSNWDWLDNIKGNSLFDFTDSLVESKIANRLGKNNVEKTVSFNEEKIKSIELSSNNEFEIVEQRNLELIDDVLPDEMRIYYISDLHLEFRLSYFCAITKDDVFIYLKRLAKHLANSIPDLCADHDNILIVDGDVCDNIDLYELFVSLLSRECNRGGRNHNYIIFTLGNHELWPFSGEELQNIYSEYLAVLSKYGCLLLNNSIIYFDLNFHKHEIKEGDLILMDDQQLSSVLSRSKLTIFGGIGFSGQNETFNADVDIYCGTISREHEINLSRSFDELYQKICRCAGSCKTVIITHMPKADWSSDQNRQSNFIYLSGHTHKNLFYLTDDIQIYADNQVGYYGYKHSYPEFKYFYVDPSCDIYESYEDGIYEISKSQYNDFLRSKNIPNICYRSFYKLYMLKKDGYFAFISQSDRGSLCILNGGAMSKLPTKSIKYVYDNMDKVVDQIDKSLVDYSNREREISSIIKSIGGDGKIHGCIIDINFYNHIYLNPYDGTITPYYALNMMSREIYLSIGNLLESRCPELYSNYLLNYKNDSSKGKLIELKRKTKSKKLVVIDYGTYIYQSSRMIKKMQKIEKNYLTTWSSSFSDQKIAITEKSSSNRQNGKKKTKKR